MILAGDIGGTKTRLAVFDETKSRLEPEMEQVFPSSRYKTLEEIVQIFVQSNDLVLDEACFGIAGPVKGDKVVATNLPWIVDAKDLAACLNIKHVSLLNDLEANAYGIEALAPEDFYTVSEGAPDSQGNAGLISAGTGLGQAGLFFDGSRLRPFATEGGHTDFAPKNDIQVELLKYLQVRYGSVSWERVLSGTGLFNIYSFLRDTGKGSDPDWLTAEIVQGDGASCISRAAQNGQSELCNMALEMFVAFYGAEAGNLALKLMATGGMYIGGGIAPKIIDRLKSPLFFDCFAAKGRFEKTLRQIPVRIILNDKAALLGAARYACLHRGLYNEVKVFS